MFQGSIDAGVMVEQIRTEPPPAGPADSHALPQTTVPLGGMLAFGNYGQTDTPASGASR
jgi:hypothetical protein